MFKEPRTSELSSFENHIDGVPIGVLLFSCPDKVGVIAALVNFFTDRELNILRYEEITEDGYHFSRCEWALDSRWDNEPDFDKEFTSYAQAFDGTFDVMFMDRKQTLGLFVSKQEHALSEVLTRFEVSHSPMVEVAFIIGNDESVSDIADRHGVPFFYIPTNVSKSGDGLAFEAKQLEIVQRYKPDLLGLACYMQALSANFIQETTCPIINVSHSSLLPYNGDNLYRTAYEKGAKLIAATAHFTTAEVGHGPIIEQDVVSIDSGSSLQDIEGLGRVVEQSVFIEALLKVIKRKAIVFKNRTVIFN